MDFMVSYSLCSLRNKDFHDADLKKHFESSCKPEQIVRCRSPVADLTDPEIKREFFAWEVVYRRQLANRYKPFSGHFVLFSAEVFNVEL